jgi:deoxyribodipyrimidine photo-lyase
MYLKKTHVNALHIFRRDLRLEDNTALSYALQECERVYPCFILNPDQITSKNSYLSYPSLQFMFDSLIDLDASLQDLGARLNLFEGEIIEMLEKIHALVQFDALYVNKDYTPFARSRDAQIRCWCEEHKITPYFYDDALLADIDSVRKDDGGLYTIFTPFFRKAQNQCVAKPRALPAGDLQVVPGALHPDESLYKRLPAKKPQVARGGRAAALDLLESLHLLDTYSTDRDFPRLQKTTHLSAHHKFGTISIRETYHACAQLFGPTCTLIRELYWRDFFTYIGYHFPHVLGQSFQKKYEKIVWENPNDLFDAWCKGKTGFPLVDAGMRELVSTGFMHNRVRMVVASFLVKDLHIDWRKGEQFFARHLVDYDPLVNNGSWQWAASTGCDAQPYYRIFNPWLQQERFDETCEYIKKWIPELASLKPEQIHAWHKTQVSQVAYPAPVVDHSIQKAQALAMFKQCD